jgi:hypothetical protein
MNARAAIDERNTQRSNAFALWQDGSPATPVVAVPWPASVVTGLERFNADVGILPDAK